MLPTRRQLERNDDAEMLEHGARESHQLLARGRVDSGIDLHDAGLRDVLESDEEPSAADVERQRAYADWLARFEPSQKRRREGQDAVGLGTDEVDSRSGERAA